MSTVEWGYWACPSLLLTAGWVTCTFDAFGSEADLSLECLMYATSFVYHVCHSVVVTWVVYVPCFDTAHVLDLSGVSLGSAVVWTLVVLAAHYEYDSLDSECRPYCVARPVWWVVSCWVCSAAPLNEGRVCEAVVEALPMVVWSWMARNSLCCSEALLFVVWWIGLSASHHYGSTMFDCSLWIASDVASCPFDA